MGIRVGVIDDELFFREAISEVLEAAGFDCVTAEDGAQAITLADDPGIGVLVLDIRMPGMDGIDVLRHLREQRPALRVLVLSGASDQETVLEALRRGACDYLAKPLHDEELVLAVGRACESYALAADAVFGVDEYDWYFSQRTEDSRLQYFTPTAIPLAGLQSFSGSLRLFTNPAQILQGIGWDSSPSTLTPSIIVKLFKYLDVYVRRRSDGARCRLSSITARRRESGSVRPSASGASSSASD